MDCQNLWEAGPLRYILNTHPGGARLSCASQCGHGMGRCHLPDCPRDISRSNAGTARRCHQYPKDRARWKTACL